MEEPKCGQDIARMNPVGQMAFVGLVQYAVTQEDVRERFWMDTGLKVPQSPASPIAAMIDKATGFDSAWAAPFIDWCWEHLWGGADAFAAT